MEERLRRLLDEVFGEVPDGDEIDDDPREPGTQAWGTPDEDLLTDRPPHHDRA